MNTSDAREEILTFLREQAAEHGWRDDPDRCQECGLDVPRLMELMQLAGM